METGQEFSGQRREREKDREMGGQKFKGMPEGGLTLGVIFNYNQKSKDLGPSSPSLRVAGLFIFKKFSINIWFDGSANEELSK